MSFRKSILQKKKTLSSFLSFPSPELIEMLGLTEWNSVVIDLEHGSIGRSDLAHLFRAAECRNLPKVVRVPKNDPKIILGALDLGVDGILFPMINTADEAKKAVASIHYPPKGIRGFAQGRAGDYGVNLSPKAFAERTEDILVAVQIESREAVKNISDISAIEGVDVIFIGPSDLSADYGLLGEPHHREVQKIISELAEVILKHNKIAGIFSNDTLELEKYVGLGYTFLLSNSTSIVVKELKNYKNIVLHSE